MPPPKDGRPYRPFMWRLVGDEYQYRCNGPCQTWKPRSEFPVQRASKHGIGTNCKTCKKAKSRAWYYAHVVEVNGLKVERRAADKAADALHSLRYRRPLFINHFYGLMVEAHVVIPALEAIEVRFPPDEFMQTDLANATGLDVRTIYDIRNLRRDIKWDTAERIALAAGREYVEALMTMLPVTGVDGWSRAGHTACVRCGTWWRRHRARGFCDRCYETWYYWVVIEGHPEETLAPPWYERWSFRSPNGCVVCGTIARKHASHGACSRCIHYARILARREGMSNREATDVLATRVIRNTNVIQ